MEDLWVPIVFLVALAFVVSLWLYFRYSTRSALQQTVRAAIEKGHDLSPDLLDRLGQGQPSGNTDLRRGVISVSIAVSFAIFAIVLNQSHAIRPLLAAASFPFMLGVAYLGLWRFAGKQDA